MGREGQGGRRDERDEDMNEDDYDWIVSSMNRRYSRQPPPRLRCLRKQASERLMKLRTVAYVLLFLL